jgi:hypothetical protein
MKSICVLTLIVTFVFAVFAQTENQPIEFNLGFEKVTANEKLPDKWLQFGSGYNLKIDTTEKKSGNNSVLIEAIASAEKSENALGAIACQIPADYQGKEIELRGFLKLKDVSDGFAGLWMRIDGDGGVLEFDNMQSRQIQGTSDWTQYTIKLPLPEAGTKIITARC